MILDILKVTDIKDLVILRSKTEPVTEFNDQLIEFARSMVETMFAKNGIGLAAPQVGKSIKMFVMRTVNGVKENSPEHKVIINPHLLMKSKTYNKALEGCLSIPGVVGRVIRYDSIMIAYQDLRGNLHQEALDGLEARVWQHENDHLKSLLFVDHTEEIYNQETMFGISTSEVFECVISPTNPAT